MSQQSEAWNNFIDGLVDRKPTLADFASTAIGEVERANMPVRYPVNKSVWPADVWAEMERIRKGEQ